VAQAICLMGPTASGKTDVAVRLADEFVVDLISVDSAMVYRGLNIGTAKPDAATLERAPHRLIDIREPEGSYSAGDFVRDAHREIEMSCSKGRIPLLVGGTMMYFRALTEGIAELPSANQSVRAQIDAEAAQQGWPALHAILLAVDPVAAARIKPNDSQRIQRALEVYRTSGRTLTDWQQQKPAELPSIDFLKIAVIPGDRKILHDRIAARLESMLAEGFVDEVHGLLRRPGLTLRSPSMRSVGYRQIGAALDNDGDLAEAGQKALFATRQLAKRQHTWLRSESDLQVFDPLEDGAYAAISCLLRDQITE
jgi:tRNA dimethylallyltransferase